MPMSPKDGIKQTLGAAVVLLCSPLILCYAGYVALLRARQRRFGRDLKDVYRRRKREYRRRKSLSDTTSVSRNFIARKLLASKTTGGKNFNTQTQSLFFRLPAEIRNQVYRYVLCSRQLVSIQPAGKKWEATRLGNAGCKDGRACKRGNGVTGPLLEEEMVLRHIVCVESFDRGRTDGGDRMLLALVRTCRLIYAETLPLLYGENTFVATLDYNFLAFALSIPQAHLDLIRSLILYLPGQPDYEQPGIAVSMAHSMYPALKVVKRMEGLKQCHFIVREDYSDREVKSLLWSLKMIEKEERWKGVFVIDWVGYVSGRIAQELDVVEEDMDCLRLLRRYAVNELEDVDLDSRSY